ncbi:GNAT family N-acetyltransferase [Halorussus sp. MSC15.2]|uniref:GNAT family N-acetyltransferase n=1 Tax=Halorussus sp. MSC15.2 TaxID=2283638 RepID=UPI0019684F9C|nr:GNAT family protein [Halorussus sp. MSC15.2]
MSGPTFLEGDRVTLRVPDEDDLTFLLEHENDPDVRATRSVSLPKGPDDVRRRFGGTLGRNDDTLALVVHADGAPEGEATGSPDDSAADRVGHVYLLRERPNDRTYRRAELAYWVALTSRGTDTPPTPLGQSSTTGSTASVSTR